MVNISLFSNAIITQRDRMIKSGFPPALGISESDFQHTINMLKMNLDQYLNTDSVGKGLVKNLKLQYIPALIVISEKLLSYEKQLKLIKPKIDCQIKLSEIRPWPYLKYLKNKQKNIYLILAVEIGDKRLCDNKTPEEWAKDFYFNNKNLSDIKRFEEELRVGLNFEEGLYLAWALLTDKEYSNIKINRKIVLAEASYLNPSADETKFNSMPALEFTSGQFIVKEIEAQKKSCYLGVANRYIKIITP